MNFRIHQIYPVGDLRVSSVLKYYFAPPPPQKNAQASRSKGPVGLTGGGAKDIFHSLMPMEFVLGLPKSTIYATEGSENAANRFFLTFHH